MRVINGPSYSISHMLPMHDRHNIVKAAQICYKSERDMSDPEEEKEFISRLHRDGHSVIEHSMVSIKMVCDRGVSHQLVRHRVGCSFAQESTRYCNYSKNKFNNEITVVRPWRIFDDKSPEYQVWYNSCLQAEQAYFKLLDFGVRPETARGVLPTSLKTELILTTNLKEWYHILDQRTRKDVHPDTRALCVQILSELGDRFAYPEIFGDLASERVAEFIQDDRKARERYFETHPIEGNQE